MGTGTVDGKPLDWSDVGSLFLVNIVVEIVEISARVGQHLGANKFFGISGAMLDIFLNSDIPVMSFLNLETYLTV